MKYLFIVFILFQCICVADAQDTLYLGKRDPRKLPFCKLPPSSFYSINKQMDTIFFVKYLTVDSVYVLKYINVPNQDIWIAYYRNKAIKEFGRFTFLGVEEDWNSGRQKVGTWVYLDTLGKFESYFNHVAVAR